jgi:hypothetical protein
MYQYPSFRTLFLLAVVCTTSASAEVYRSIDEHGNVTFTNQPTQGAEPVQLKPLSVYEAPTVKPASNKNIADSTKVPAYESVEIISPKADETLRDNTGNVTVTAGSKPALDSRLGHRFQFYLNGKPVDKPQAAVTKTFPNVDRGEHRVEVAIVDSKGRELARSQAVRFFLHRQTIFSPVRGGGAN